MRDTICSILLRWGVEVEDDVRRIDIKGVTPASSSTPCLHQRTGIIDLSQELPFCSSWDEYEGSTGSRYCSTFHFKEELTPVDQRFQKMVSLIALASTLKLVELETWARCQNLIRQPGKPPPFMLSRSLVAHRYDHELEPFAKEYGIESLLSLTTRYANNALRGLCESSPEKLFSNFGLMPSIPESQLAYFELIGNDFDLLLVMKELYPYIKAQSDNPKTPGKAMNIFLMPLATVKAQHKRRALETKKQVRINQPCWNDKTRGIKGNFDSLAHLGNVYYYPQVSNRAEFDETLEVLAKEMPFKDALNAAAIFANS